jgi:hypothetical protein
VNRFDNQRKAKFLESIPTASLDNPDCPLTRRCKFNFGYFEKQPFSQSFDEWNQKELEELFGKLRDFSKEPLKYWMGQSVGKSGKVLSIYGAFPAKSDLVHPKHVPHQVEWGRFRLDWSGRLCGFVVPRELHGVEHQVTGHRFDANTFYIVFLDRDHCFYKGKEQK